MDGSLSGSKQTAEFVKLLTSHQRQLYVYIRTLLPQAADADEVLQETNVVLWSKVSEFAPDTSFVAWARKVAYFQVLAFRKRSARGRLTFSSELVATIAEETAGDAARLDQRRAALDGCLQKLPQRDRELVARRFTAGATANQLAEEMHLPLRNVYRALERVRLALLTCIRRTIVAQERSS
jgi:RNA polymerase sigma-70 factor (ECF subfamily)